MLACCVLSAYVYLEDSSDAAIAVLSLLHPLALAVVTPIPSVLLCALEGQETHFCGRNEGPPYITNAQKTPLEKHREVSLSVIAFRVRSLRCLPPTACCMHINHGPRFVAPPMFVFIFTRSSAGEPFARERAGRRSCQGGRFRVRAKVHARERPDDAVRNPRIRRSRDSHAQVSLFTDEDFFSFEIRPISGARVRPDQVPNCRIIDVSNEFGSGTAVHWYCYGAATISME